MTARQTSLLFLLAGIWGASFLFMRVLLDAGVDPAGVSGGRTVLGFLVLLPFAWLGRARFPRDARTWAALAVLGSVNFAFPWTLFSVGQQHVPSGVGSIVNSAQPLFAAIFSTFLIRGSYLGRQQVAGLLVGFAGVAVLMEGNVQSLGRESLQGIPLMLGAVVCYSICTVAIRRWLHHVSPVALTFGQIGFAALYLAPVALATGSFEGAAMGWHEWASLAVLGGAGSGIAVIIWMWLIGEVGPVRAAVVTYLMPVVGVFLGWLLLDESVGWDMAVGLALIVAGVAVVQGLPARLAVRRRPSVATV